MKKETFNVRSKDGGDVTPKRTDVSKIQSARVEKTPYRSWLAQGNP
jgi:hypothetical protein